MLIENANIVVAWWSGAKGGTEYTLKKARKLGIYTINLHPKEQLQLSFND
jgi:precorrin-6x reductase